MFDSTKTAVVIESPLLSFVAILEGTVAVRGDESGEEATAAQIEEILQDSLNRIVSNGGITADTPAVAETYSASVRVESCAPEGTDYPVLARLDHLESMLTNLVNCWRKGEDLDAVMHSAEQLLKPETI